MRLRPPRPPGVTGKPGETTYGGGVQSGESFCIRAKTVRQLSARHDPYFGFPLRAAKQGRGNESVFGETENRSSACGTATDTSRSETAPPAGGDEV